MKKAPSIRREAAQGRYIMRRPAVILLLAALLLALLAGCKRSELVTIGPIIDEWQATSQTSVAQVEFELVESTDFSDTLGFRASSLPDSALYTLDRIFIIDNWYVQFEFSTADSRSLVLLAAEAEGRPPLTTTRVETHPTAGETYAFGDVEVITHTSSNGCAIAAWQRSGYQYLLHSSPHYGMPPEEDIAAMAEHLVMEAA